MIRGLEDALEGVLTAYEPRIGGLDLGGRAEAAPRAEPPPAPRPAPLSKAPHLLQIGTFVDALPLEQLPSWITAIVNRICGAAEEAEKKWSPDFRISRESAKSGADK